MNGFCVDSPAGRRFAGRPARLGQSLLGLIFAGVFMFAGASEVRSFSCDGVGGVEVLHAGGRHVNRDALCAELETVVRCFRENRLVPLKVKIWGDHTVVEEALAGFTVVLTVVSEDGTPARLILPVQDGGRRIIVRRGPGANETWELAGLPDDVRKPDLAKCFR